MADWFMQARWWEITIASIVLNCATLLSSVFLYRILVNKRAVSHMTRSPSTRDRLLTASTTIVNTLVVLLPWWLWTRGSLHLAPISFRLLLEVVYLIVMLDLAMYVLHRIFHQEILFRMFHQMHHTEDAKPSRLTLFVMHPAEAAGFGAVMLVLMLLWPVSVSAIAVFLGANLLIGTAAHVPFSKAGRWDSTLGGSRLHQGHHQRPDTNFGFFTQFWDRSFGTFK